MKKTGFYGFVYDFSVDYDAIAGDDISDILNYLIKQNNMKWKKMFVAVTGFIGLNVYAIPLKCVSMSHQECKLRPVIMDIKHNEPLFYPFNVLVNKSRGSCININNPYSKLCVPDVVKHMNIKVFNPMSGTNETKHISWHETCVCK